MKKIGFLGFLLNCFLINGSWAEPPSDEVFLDRMIVSTRQAPHRYVRNDRDFSYELYLENLTDERVEGVDYHERFEGFSIRRVTPNGEVTANCVSWKNLSLNPRERLTFTIHGRQNLWNRKIQQSAVLQWGNATLKRQHQSGSVRGILVDRQMLPEIIPRNQELTYKILVRNLRGEPVSGIELKEETAGVEIVRTEPEAMIEQSTLVWRNISLASRGQNGSEQYFYVTIRANDVGSFNLCFGLKFCDQFNVGQPELVLTKICPPESGLCDTFSYTFRIENAGNITARNVYIDDVLPEGILTKGNTSHIGIFVGDLGPGAIREYTVPMKATATGSYTNTAHAFETESTSKQQEQSGGTPKKDGAQSSSSAGIEIKSAALQISKSGPTMRYLGRPIQYEIHVTNTGNMPTEGIHIYDEIQSSGAQLVSASDGGRIHKNRVIWNLPSLNIGETKTVTVEYRATGICLVQSSTWAQTKCAEDSVQTSTEVRGITALLLEVVDVQDPIEVGANETYTISVTNQGSADAVNIRLRVEVPAEMDLIDFQAPVQRVGGSGNVIEFDSLPVLKSRTVAKYRVRVKGRESGDVRFKVQMTSDSLDSEVTETESTHIYR